MFRFENEYILYGLLVIPVIIAIYIGLNIRAKKRLARYGDLSLLQKLMPERSSYMKNGKFSLLMGALAFFILALANPQIGSRMEKGMQKGVDIMVCFDISNSMLAEDIQPNRLEASKMAMSRFVDKLEGDRIGLVVFAGNAFVQLPVTSDYAAAKMFVNAINTGMMNQQGTDIAAAIDLAVVSMLPEDENREDPQDLKNLTSKTVIVISDGEDHFDAAAKKAAQARELGVTVHTIGIGSIRGEPIPVKGRDGSVHYKKDKEGNTVITRLNESELRAIASAGGGTYVHAHNANMGFETILDEINKMYKADIQEVTFSRYENRYQIPLLIGLILLFVETLLFDTKPRWWQWFNQKQKNMGLKALFLMGGFLLTGSLLQAQTRDELKAIRRGNSEFKEAEKLRLDAENNKEEGGEINGRKALQLREKASGKYQDAEIDYRRAMETTRTYDKAQYNLGASLYRQEKYQDAAESFKNVAEYPRTDKELRVRAYHNLGNSLLMQGKYEESIEAYKNALKLEPSDMDTKYNLEYARQKLKKEQQKQQQNQQSQSGDSQQDKGQGESQQQQGRGENNDRQNQGNPSENSNDRQNLQKDPQQSPAEGKDGEQSEAEKWKKEMEKRQLDALQQNERQTQRKVQQYEMRKGKKVPQEKDW